MILFLKVKAGARVNKIHGFLEINKKNYLKVSITEAPEAGNANKALIQFLSKEWKIPQMQFEITQGNTNSFKTLNIKI